MADTAAFQPVTLTKDGLSRDANSAVELVRLNADGWTEGQASIRQRAARERRAATKTATPAKRAARKTAAKKADAAPSE